MMNIDNDSMQNDEIMLSRDVSIQDPKFLKKWNWGAFWFPLIWCLCNYCYWQALLCLIPYFNFIWKIVVGLRGNRWAWNSGKWENSMDFDKTQRKWDVAGVFFLIIIAISMLIVIIANLF